jgi:hypothetical protein
VKKRQASRQTGGKWSEGRENFYVLVSCFISCYVYNNIQVSFSFYFKCKKIRRKTKKKRSKKTTHKIKGKMLLKTKKNHVKYSL